MTPQEKIIVAIAEVQGILDYYRTDCKNQEIDCLELEEDINRMDNILNEVLNYVHQTNEKDTIINNPVKA